MTAPSLRMTRGDTLTWTLDGFTPADITGWTPRWTLKPASGWASAPDSDATATATPGSGLTVTSTSPASIDLVVDADVTAAWDPGVYVWDLQLVSGSEVRTVEWDAAHAAVGTLTVAPDVTRTVP